LAYDRERRSVEGVALKGANQEKEMRSKFLVSVTVLALFAGGQAFAQAVSATIDLSPEQRTTIKQYVVKEKVPRATIKERVTVGAVLPSDVETHTVPGTWGPSVSRYRYVYSDNRVYFVEPSSRKVVHVID
jgi:hypothetical protein